MQAVVFKTPGLLDLRAITTFGINAKPNSTNPIGFFGTGLKYAIAVCLRYKQPIRLFVGEMEYYMQAKEQDFRGKGFTFIQMKRRKGLTARWSYHTLPFTLELGKTWELWQAFREFYSNTLDEGGHTTIWDTSTADFDDECYLENDNRTMIVVEGEEFVKEYEERDKTFLPQGLRLQQDGADIQIFEAPSKHVYYRSMRVMDLEHDSVMTYNILKEIELTEDRTAKNPFYIEIVIRQALVEAKVATRVVIEKALTAPKESYEAKFNYNYMSDRPSDTFNEVVRACAAVGSVTSIGALDFAKKYAPSESELAEKEPTWRELLVESVLADNDSDRTLKLIYDNKEEFINLIKESDPF